MTLLADAPPSKPVAVLELFTSEGCSSCPPADALLEKFSSRPGVITLSFHVDYWNDLGWEDPYSAGFSTERQRLYSARLAKGRTYTPQLVVNGELEFVGSDAARLTGALEHPRPLPVEVLVTRAQRVGNTIEAAVSPSTATVFLVQRQVQGKVTRGENSGATLRHVNVVRAISAGGATVRFRIPDHGPQQFSVVAVVQDAKTLRIDGAALRTVE